MQEWTPVESDLPFYESPLPPSQILPNEKGDQGVCPVFEARAKVLRAP